MSAESILVMTVFEGSLDPSQSPCYPSQYGLVQSSLLGAIASLPAAAWNLSSGPFILFWGSLVVLLFLAAQPFPVLAGPLDNLGGINLVLLVLLSLKETPARKKQLLYSAWQRVEAAEGKKFSPSRIVALQDLNVGGESLSGLDLSGANRPGIRLPGARLSQGDLSDCNLDRADLERADLIEARMVRASLSKANLERADLSFACLTMANLSLANLSGAKLVCTRLDRANLGGAVLRGANFNGAQLSGALLSGADLTGALVDSEMLKEAVFAGAIMPDGSAHD